MVAVSNPTVKFCTGVPKPAVTWYSSAPGNDLSGSPLVGIVTPPDDDGAGAGAVDDVPAESSPKRERMRRASRWRTSSADGVSTL